MPDWNELFLQPKNRWLEPHEKIVEFAQLFSQGASPRILDLGSGAGRHVIYFASQGFDAYGCDISPNGLAYTHSWLVNEGLKAHLARMDMTRLGYAKDSFDGLVSMYVIYHNPLAGIRQTIAEIYRVLKPGGWALITFMGKRGYRYQRGQALEKDTFLSIDGDDPGIPHHYSDLAEFDRELNAFVIHRVELLEESTNQGLRHSHWCVLIQKPEG